MSDASLLDLADIQGNIVLPYGRYGFPWSRHLLFHIGEAAAGRRFLAVLRGEVTSAQRWLLDPGDPAGGTVPRPEVTLNLALSFGGLRALDLPTRTLAEMPEEFIDGMTARAHILGDFGRSAARHWDPVWRSATQGYHAIHLWVSMSAGTGRDGRPVDALGQRTDWLLAQAQAADGVHLLAGHRGADPRWQDSCARMQVLPDGSHVLTVKEHFGFTDGISDPVFAGQYPAEESALEVPGGGRLDVQHQQWQPLAPGEFLLGHPCEAQELPTVAEPWGFTRNGSFLAVRKLHQNVGSFDRYIEEQARRYQRVAGFDGIEEARETLKAKMAGRWTNGIPLMAAADWATAQALAARYQDVPAIQRKPRPQRSAAEQAQLRAYESLLSDFRYGSDPAGARCPVTAHTRRSNPRDGLDPKLGVPGHAADTSLSNRRRILRRGLPYGDSTLRDDEGEHGVLFMAVCASLFRQFEFVQQQWIEYGSVFGAGNDTDPLIGSRGPDNRFTIPVDPAGSGQPCICARLPQFVETRGGEYFFLPSLTALRQIAEGSVDPT